MALEVFAVVAVLVLFTGMFLALLFSYRDIEDRRARRPAAVVRPAAPLYGFEARSKEIAEELMLRQIEHHLRREAFHAEQFVRNPNPQTLRAGETVAWSALVAPFRFTMSGRAGTDVELIAFSTRELQAAIEAYPDAGVRVVTNLAAVIARRLQVMHAMWTRELQRTINVTFGEGAGA